MAGQLARYNRVLVLPWILLSLSCDNSATPRELAPQAQGQLTAPTPSLKVVEQDVSGFSRTVPPEDDSDGDGIANRNEAPDRVFVADVPRLRIENYGQAKIGFHYKLNRTEKYQFDGSYEFSDSRADSTYAYTRSHFGIGVGKDFAINLNASETIYAAVPPSSVSVTDLRVGVKTTLTLPIPWISASYNSDSATASFAEIRRKYYSREARSITEERELESQSGFLEGSIIIFNDSNYDVRLSEIVCSAVVGDNNDRRVLGEVRVADALEGRPSEVVLYAGQTAGPYLLKLHGLNSSYVEEAVRSARPIHWVINKNYRIMSLDGSIDWRARMANVRRKCVAVTLATPNAIQQYDIAIPAVPAPLSSLLAYSLKDKIEFVSEGPRSLEISRLFSFGAPCCAPGNLLANDCIFLVGYRGVAGKLILGESELEPGSEVLVSAIRKSAIEEERERVLGNFRSLLAGALEGMVTTQDCSGSLESIPSRDVLEMTYLEPFANLKMRSYDRELIAFVDALLPKAREMVNFHDRDFREVVRELGTIKELANSGKLSPADYNKYFTKLVRCLEEADRLYVDVQSICSHRVRALLDGGVFSQATMARIEVDYSESFGTDFSWVGVRNAGTTDIKDATAFIEMSGGGRKRNFVCWAGDLKPGAWRYLKLKRLESVFIDEGYVWNDVRKDRLYLLNSPPPTVDAVTGRVVGSNVQVVFKYAYDVQERNKDGVAQSELSIESEDMGNWGGEDQLVLKIQGPKLASATLGVYCDGWWREYTADSWQDGGRLTVTAPNKALMGKSVAMKLKAPGYEGFREWKHSCGNE